MSAIILNLPDELTRRLHGQEDRLPEILELGLRDLSADSQVGFVGATCVFEVLASLPSPREVMALRPSAQLSTRVAELLEKNRAEGLSPLVHVLNSLDVVGADIDQPVLGVAAQVEQLG